MGRLTLAKTPHAATGPSADGCLPQYKAAAFK